MRRSLPAATLGFALSVLFASPALSQYSAPHRPPYQHGYEFNPYLTFNSFQSKTQLNDDVGFGFRFGYLYTPHHEMEFLWDYVHTHDSVFTSDHVDINNFQFAYVYNFTKREVVPYLTAGVGVIHTDDQDLGTESDFVVALGAGVRFFLGRAFYMRFELRENFFRGGLPVYADGEEFHNALYAFGLGWRFGAP